MSNSLIWCRLRLDGVVRVPKAVLQKANADLQSLRMAVFNLLQPKLRCKLGKRSQRNKASSRREWHSYFVCVPIDPTFTNNII